MQTPPTTPTVDFEQGRGPLTTSGLAIASLVCGVLGCLFPLGLIAIILGIVAMTQISKPERRLRGHGMALAGTILGVVFTGLAVLALPGVLVAGLGGARKNAQRMENATRVRGIHQAMFQYAQGNQQKYPGLDKDVQADGSHETASYRLELLMQANFFTAEYVISPVDEDKVANSFPHTDPDGEPTEHFSYALLEIAASASGRIVEWGATANSEAAVVFDRETSGTGTLPAGGSGARSIHSETDWRGAVGYNDNHVLFETTNILARTRYGATTNDRSADPAVDDLWEDRDAGGGTGSNAMGIYN